MGDINVYIVHTLENGTVVYGTSRGDGTGRILKNAGCRPSRWLPDHPEHGPAFWYFPNSQRNLAKAWVIGRAKTELEKAGVTVHVEIDNVTLPTTPFAEHEAGDYERSEDRAARLAERAVKRYSSGKAAVDQVREERGRIPLGQPVMPGHHSYKSDMNRRDRWHRKEGRGIAEMDYGRDLAARADTAGRFKGGREAAGTTLRRIDKLETEIRGHRRTLEQITSDGRRAELGSLIAMREEELVYWRGLIEHKQAEEGLKVWGPDDFKAGDFVHLGGGWYAEVLRVNKKTVTLPWGHYGIGLWVLSAEVAEAAKSGDREKFIRETLPYDKVRGRKTADEIAAYLEEKGSNRRH